MEEFKHVYITPHTGKGEIDRLFLHRSSIDGKVTIGMWDEDGVSSTVLREFGQDLVGALSYYLKLAGNLHHYIDTGEYL